jgi:hypothetical protein
LERPFTVITMRNHCSQLMRAIGVDSVRGFLLANAPQNQGEVEIGK